MKRFELAVFVCGRAANASQPRHFLASIVHRMVGQVTTSPEYSTDVSDPYSKYPRFQVVHEHFPIVCFPMSKTRLSKQSLRVPDVHDHPLSR